MHRLPAIAAVLALLGVAPAAPAVAQQTSSATYFGWDGPPSMGGGTYIANVYGDAIEIVARNDQCGRPFYIQGVMSIVSTRNSGTIGGTMYRCTNPELVGAPCQQPPNYETSFQGMVQRDVTTRRLTLNLTYTMEIWNKDECKKDHDEQRTDILQLLYQPPTPPPPTTTQTISDTFDDAKQKIFDFVWTFGGLSPR
jgi:hypothetical protein